ncbi:MAG: rod shape-determining protein MreC [Anaplasmataceae bacterium]|nr:rod shape-determining protein MreC [Anaplasmataceae bacterium]
MRPPKLTTLLFIFLLGLMLYWPDVIWWIRPQFSVDPKSEEGRALSIENAYLKSELAKQTIIDSDILNRRDYKPAFVYGRYPFNFKEELVISVGGEGGIKLGGAALLKQNSLDNQNLPHIFIGNVSTTQRSISVVKTIFDYRWQSAVHIGSKAVPGLLEGGLDPKVVLIPKDASLKEGDVVVNADNRFEYGLPIGRVRRVSLSEDNLFQNAELDLPYDLSSISLLWIERLDEEVEE